MKTLPWIIVVILPVFLASCSASNRLKRAERLIAKAEANGAVWSTKSKTDTVFRIDTVFVTGGRFDTLVKYTTDTITVTKDKIVTKVKVSPGKTIYVETKCPDKIVVKKVPYTVTHTITKTIKAGYSWFQLLLAGLFGLVVGYLIGRILGR